MASQAGAGRGLTAPSRHVEVWTLGSWPVDFGILSVDFRILAVKFGVLPYGGTMVAAELSTVPMWTLVSPDVDFSILTYFPVAIYQWVTSLSRGL